jgi:hypothetical protein
MLKTVTRPLGGAMMLGNVMVDKRFKDNTAEDFSLSFNTKVKSYQVLGSLVDLDSLDFVILFSSTMGLFGNAGQTTYCR